MIKVKICSKKTIREQSSISPKSTTFRVEADPSLFLQLTPSEGTISKRASLLGQFSQRQADIGGGIILWVDPESGNVIEHSGRARSLAATNAGLKNIQMNIVLKDGSKPITWQEMPRQLHQQGGNNIVDIANFNFIPSGEPVQKDILGLSGEPVTFTDTIYKGKDGSISLGETAAKKAITYLGTFYSQKYIPYYTKTNNIKPDSTSHIIPMAQEYAKYLNDNYTIQDDNGILGIVAKTQGFIKPVFNRETVGPIVIKTS